MQNLNDFLTIMYDKSKIGISFIGKDGKILKANPFFFKLIGLEKIGNRDFNFFNDFEVSVGIYHKIITGNHVSFDFIYDPKKLNDKFICSFNHSIHLHANVCPCIDNDQIIGFFVYLQLISNEMMNNIVKNKLNFYFQNGYNHFPIGIIAFSSTGNILGMNSYIENLFQIDKTEMKKMNFKDCGLFGSEDNVQSIHSSLFVEKKPLVDLRMQTWNKKGEELFVKINSYKKTDSKNEMSQIIIFLEDITEWKLIENSKNIMAEKINDLKDQLDSFKYVLDRYSKQHHKQKAADLYQFTAREKEIINFIQKGLSNKEIAYKMNLSVPTIKRNVAMVFKKTNTKNKASLMSLLTKTLI